MFISLAYQKKELHQSSLTSWSSYKSYKLYAAKILVWQGMTCKMCRQCTLIWLYILLYFSSLDEICSYMSISIFTLIMLVCSVIWDMLDEIWYFSCTEITFIAWLTTIKLLDHLVNFMVSVSHGIGYRIQLLITITVNAFFLIAATSSISKYMCKRWVFLNSLFSNI